MCSLPAQGSCVGTGAKTGAYNTFALVLYFLAIHMHVCTYVAVTDGFYVVVLMLQAPTVLVCVVFFPCGGCHACVGGVVWLSAAPRAFARWFCCCCSQPSCVRIYLGVPNAVLLLAGLAGVWVGLDGCVRAWGGGACACVSACGQPLTPWH